MRTKRNFDGTEPTGKKIGDLLPQVLREIGPPVDFERNALFAYWNSLLEEKMARFTQPVSWKNGVLTIKVKSATLYAVLQRHEKARLVKALQSKFPVRDIVLSVG